MPRLIQDGEVPGGGGGGSVTGTISKQIPFVEDWGTGPTAGTKGNFDTLDFDPDTDNGVKFDFKVPDDYDSGDLTLSITYAMATSVSSPNNQIRLEWEADIIDVSDNSIDTGTYTAAGVTLTVREDQNPDRTSAASIVIDAVDFQAGDTIQIRLKRDADHGDDDHTGNWQVIGFDFSYTGQVGTRNHFQHIQLFADTDETAPASGTKGNFNTLDYSAGAADNEQKFECMVPEHWDGMSDLHIRLTYALDTGTGGDVVLETEGSIADVSGNDVDTIAVQKFILTCAASTNPYRSVVIRSISANDIGAGDTLVIKLARRAFSDPDDTADSDVFQVINATVVTGVGPSTGFDVISISEGYLSETDFAQISGSASADKEPAQLDVDFEQWFYGRAASGSSNRVNISWAGRMALTQTTVKQIKIPVQAPTKIVHGSVTSGPFLVGETVTGTTGSGVVVEVGSLHLWMVDISGSFTGTLNGGTSGAQASYTSTGTRGEYQLKVYTEGNGDTNQYGASSLTTGPTSRTEITLTDTDLTDATPSGDGRFHVVMEITVDADEWVRVGRPFVKQE